MKPTWWWRALGGSAATSWPVLMIPIVIAIPTAALNARVWQMPTREAVLGQVAGAGAMVITLLVARWTWLRPRGFVQPRSILVAVTFGAASAARLAAMGALFAALGAAGDWPIVVSVLSGGIGQAILLGLGSIAVNGLRGHAEAVRRLRATGQRIARARSLTLDEVRAMQDEVAEEVLDSARSLLDSARSGADVEQVSDAVRRAATDVVRPASHSLHSGDLIQERISGDDSRMRWRSVVGGVRPLAPVLGPVVYELLVLGAVWGAFGSTVALINLVVATPLLILGNLVLARVWRSRRVRRLPFLSLILGFALGNMVALVTVIVVTSLMGYPTLDLVVGFGLYPAAMLIGSIALSVRDRQDETERSLAQAVEDEARAMNEALRLAEDERHRLAHVMHGQVQAEMTAAAARLTSLGDEGSESVSEVIDDLLMKLDLVDFSGSSESHQTLSDLWETWALAIPLDVCVSAESQAVIEADERVDQRLVAIASEAITNAVRHGAQDGVTVDIEQSGDLVTIEVRNIGRLDVRQAGLGMREIEQFAESWSVAQEGDEVVLTAAVRASLPVA